MSNAQCKCPSKKFKIYMLTSDNDDFTYIFYSKSRINNVLKNIKKQNKKNPHSQVIKNINRLGCDNIKVTLLETVRFDEFSSRFKYYLDTLKPTVRLFS